MPARLLPKTKTSSDFRSVMNSGVNAGRSVPLKILFIGKFYLFLTAFLDYWSIDRFICKSFL